MEEYADDHKECRKCYKNKPVTEFRKDRGRKDGYGYYCRECFKASQHDYYMRNKERVNIKVERYRAKMRVEKKAAMESFEEKQARVNAYNEEVAAKNAAKSNPNEKIEVPLPPTVTQEDIQEVLAKQQEELRRIEARFALPENLASGGLNEQLGQGTRLSNANPEKIKVSKPDQDKKDKALIKIMLAAQLKKKNRSNARKRGKK